MLVADLSLRWAHIHFVDFVMSRLKYQRSMGYLCTLAFKYWYLGKVIHKWLWQLYQKLLLENCSAFHKGV